jgi:dUTP pyrophosphatase
MGCNCEIKENILKIKYLDHYNLKLCGEMKYEMPGDACFYAKAAIYRNIVIKNIKFNKVDRTIIPLGFKVEIPFGYEMQVRIRSGISKKYGITMSNGIGTIDSGYRGEVAALISNLGTKNVIIKPGMRICQCKIAEVPKFKLVSVSHLSETKRGKGGFGHTGDL